MTTPPRATGGQPVRQGELGRAIVSPRLLGTSRCEGLAVAKQELWTHRLMYGCVANSRGAGTLNSGGGGLGFLDFLGSCQDYQGSGLPEYGVQAAQPRTRRQTGQQGP